MSQRLTRDQVSKEGGIGTGEADKVQEEGVWDEGGSEMESEDKEGPGTRRVFGGRGSLRERTRAFRCRREAGNGAAVNPGSRARRGNAGTIGHNGG